jgi:hypothetical protein
MKYEAIIETLENVMDDARYFETLTEEEINRLVDHLHEVCSLLYKV